MGVAKPVDSRWLQPSDQLRSIRIDNFRGIERLELSFATPKGGVSSLVVLGGPNGSGKTAVLEACLLSYGLERVIEGPVGRAGIRRGARDYQIEGEFVRADESTIRYSRNSTSEPQVISPLVLYLPSGRTTSLVGALGITSGRRGEPKDSLDQSGRPSRLAAIKQHLINAWAHSMATKGLHGRTATHTYEIAIQPINRIWQMFYPNSSQRFDVATVGADPDSGFDVFLFEADETQLPVDYLSSGQMELFMFAGSISSLKGDQPSAVFVDEVELHLDPQWHRLMLRAMRALLPSTQLIVTTHSPAIYNSALSFERHFLVPEDDPRAKIWAYSDAAQE